MQNSLILNTVPISSFDSTSDGKTESSAVKDSYCSTVNSQEGEELSDEDVINCCWKWKIQNPSTRVQNYFGGQAIFKLKLSLFLFPLDFILDSLTAASHIFRGNYFEGVLTYLIVLVSGVLISVGFLTGDPSE